MVELSIQYEILKRETHCHKCDKKLKRGTYPIILRFPHGKFRGRATYCKICGIELASTLKNKLTELLIQKENEYATQRSASIN